MTKENRNLLINTVLVLLVSTLLLLTLVFFIPTTSADKIFGTKVKLKNKEYFRLPPTVEKIEEAYKGERLLGTVYTVKEDNNYGYVRLKVAIDDKGLIVGIGQDINQTYPEKEHSQQVFNYIESLSGSKVANPESLGLDAVAKPTTVVTLGSVNKILDTVAIHAGYKEATKPPLPGDDVVEFLKDDVIDGVNVKVYKATNEYDYILGSGVLSFEFAISEDDKLIAFEELEYNHSDGDYKVRTIKYLNDLITNETDLKGVSDIDGEAGSTQSITAVKDLLKRVIAFKNGEVIEPEYVEYEGTEEVDEKTVYVYKATKEYEYVLGSGVLSFKFKVDALGVLVAYEVVEYGHSDGDFKTRTLAYIQKLIDDKVNVKDASDIDGEANSTQSIDAVKDLLKLVAKFIDENPIEEEPEVPEEGIKFIKEDKIDGVDVVIYQATGNYSYDKGTGLISYKFTVDTNGVLISYEEVYYAHTPGFKANVIKFLDRLITEKQNINTIKDTDFDIDGKLGSTFTAKGIIELIKELHDFVEGGK